MEDFAPITGSYCADTDRIEVSGFILKQQVGDSGGDFCSEYWDNPHWCGQYDTLDFQSNDMCCACDGGE